MRIKIKLGEVELLYEQDDDNGTCSAATAKEGYSSRSVQTQLMKTIREMAEVAKELNGALYK